MKSRRIFLLLIAAVVLGAGWYLYGGSSVPQGQPALLRLSSNNISSLKDAFNSSASSIRVLVTFSPT